MKSVRITAAKLDGDYAVIGMIDSDGAEHAFGFTADEITRLYAIFQDSMNVLRIKQDQRKLSAEQQKLEAQIETRAAALHNRPA